MDVDKMFEVEPGEFVTRMVPWRNFIVVATDRSIYLISPGHPGDLDERAMAEVQKIAQC